MFHKRGGDIKAYTVRQRMLIILVVKDYIEPFLVEDYTIQRFAIVTLLCIQNECQPDYKTQLDDSKFCLIFKNKKKNPIIETK